MYKHAVILCDYKNFALEFRLIVDQVPPTHMYIQAYLIYLDNSNTSQNTDIIINED